MDETIINQLKKIELDENGLIKGITYKFTDEGLIDWRSMVPLKYLYINPNAKIKERLEKRYNKPYAELDIEKDHIEDNYLVILLSGLKYLLGLRRYEYVKFEIKESNSEYASVNCQILFAPNYETSNKSIIYSDNACATLANTNGFGNNYLVEMATNRSLARCIRSCLQINIVSKEEMPPGSEPNIEQQSFLSNSKQFKMLKDIMEAKKVTWATIKERLKLDGIYQETWTDIEKLPNDIVFNLIERLKKKPS